MRASVLLVLSFVSLVACSAPTPAAPPSARSPEPTVEPAPSAAVPLPQPRTDLPDYARWVAAKMKARTWLNAQHYDPATLATAGLDDVYINSVKTWAELLETYLGMTNHPIMAPGVAALLSSQNDDRSFGNVAAMAAEHGPRVGEHAKLHPTLVTLRALAEHFDPMPWNLGGPVAHPATHTGEH